MPPVRSARGNSVCRGCRASTCRTRCRAPRSRSIGDSSSAEFEASGRDPSEWPYDVAAAAQWQMLTARDAIDLPLAARIVMEAAIPMSKVDPRTILGA